MAGRLFKRNVNVLLRAAIAPPAYESAFSAFFQYKHEATVEITDLRVQFSIEKQLGKDPNTCTMTITNLNQQSRAFTQTKPLHVIVSAGYDGELHELFRGDVRYVQSARVSPDWETTFELGDGDRAFRHAYLSRSYPAGASARTVVLDLVKAMGLTASPWLSEATELKATYVSGISVHGRCAAELTRILAPYKLTWSIQNGTLSVLKDGDPAPGAALPVSEQFGLVDVPTFAPPEVQSKTAKKKKSALPTLSLKTLLYPQITPGGRIQVTSQAANGTFVVERVTHQGDTHGDEWTTEIECKPGVGRG